MRCVGRQPWHPATDYARHRAQRPNRRTRKPRTKQSQFPATLPQSAIRRPTAAINQFMSEIVYLQANIDDLAIDIMANGGEVPQFVLDLGRLLSID